MNRVEKAELEQLLAATEHTMRVATSAGGILARVNSAAGTAPGQVLSGTRLEEDDCRVDILYPGSLTWPSAFNAYHELAHTPRGPQHPQSSG